MFKYKKSMMSDFKFPFDGLETIEENYSQSLQDMFCLAVLNGKRNGTFLEIGAFHPEFLSNSLLLERDYGWEGVSVDYDASVEPQFREYGRKAKFITGDATKLDYNKILSGITDYRCDYLQLDIEPNIQTLNCLKILHLDNFRFSYISYETDVYDPTNSFEYNDAIRRESREILQSHGYILVNGNVENLGNDPFEDWYLDGKYFDKDIINKFKREDDSPMRAKDYMLRNQ